MKFLGRKSELASLHRLWERPSAQLLLIYGQRRIGKSYLLQQFIRDKPAIFYQATQQSAPVELAAFSEALRPLICLPGGVNFPTWDAALSSLSEYAQKKPLIVILDEFPNLCDSIQGFASIIQRWWDLKGQHSHIRLILCGSAQTFMNELDTHAAPLYGRFTARLVIKPVSYREASEFVASLSSEDQALVYGLLGGTPFYLDQWDVAKSVHENILALFGDSLSSMLDAPDRMLTTSLSDPKAAYRVLQAIAFGKTRWAEIKEYAKVHDRAITQLVEIGLVERRVPITEDPERSRRSTYRIPDPNLRFWFRFILRNRGQIERGLGAAVVEASIMPFLDNHMGQVYEDIARAFSYELVANNVLTADSIGYWQSTDGQHEIDIVGVLNRHPQFIGTVKWQKQPIDMRVIYNLEGHAHALGVTDEIPRLVIGRNGLSSEAQRVPNIYGFSIHDLYGPIERAMEKFTYSTFPN